MRPFQTARNVEGRTALKKGEILDVLVGTRNISSALAL
jgi:hypothetical protein